MFVFIEGLLISYILILYDRRGNLGVKDINRGGRDKRRKILCYFKLFENVVRDVVGLFNEDLIYLKSSLVCY
jgi:hypothetical protein